jgi:hypothetical protein
MENVGAVGKHRRRCLASVEAALVDLADVGHELGLDPARVARELGQAMEELIVGNGLERSFVCHAPNIGPTFSASDLA